MWHWGDPLKDWDPGKAYYDIAGGDTYSKGIQAPLFNKLKEIHGETIPIPYHECGTLTLTLAPFQYPERHKVATSTIELLINNSIIELQKVL
jgi:hypothetical protein